MTEQVAGGEWQRDTLTVEVQDMLMGMFSDDVTSTDPDSPLTSLGVDSILRLVLIDKLEARYGVELDAQDLPPDATLRDVAGLVGAALGAA